MNFKATIFGTRLRQCFLAIGAVAFLGHSSAFAQTAEVQPKPWETDPYLVEDLCGYILDGEYGKFVGLITEKCLKVHEAWQAIDCSTIGEIGPTPAHTAIETSFFPLSFTNDILNILKSERRSYHRSTGETLETGHLFDEVKYVFGIPRTILDITRLRRSRASAQNIKDELEEIELQLIELGAKSARELGYENARDWTE